MSSYGSDLAGLWALPQGVGRQVTFPCRGRARSRYTRGFSQTGTLTDQGFLRQMAEYFTNSAVVSYERQEAVTSPGSARGRPEGCARSLSQTASCPAVRASRPFFHDLHQTQSAAAAVIPPSTAELPTAPYFLRWPPAAHGAGL